MKLPLGFSPCPNDTFIFDALVHHKIDTEGIEFEVFLDDVETLNQKAFRGELDITKLSFHAYAYVLQQYVLLDSGSALGFGVGPLLIAAPGFDPSRLSGPSSHAGIRVGIPGKYTTANFLLNLAYPHLIEKKELVFSEIEDALLRGEIDLGLIIHENRFTYENKGLVKIMDLGDFWEKRTGCAIPLGGIVIRRDLDPSLQETVSRLVRKSVEFAFADPKSGLDFIRSHAQEMSEEVMYQHIGLYVNRYSVDLGPEGRKAVALLFETANDMQVVPPSDQPIFLSRMTSFT